MTCFSASFFSDSLFKSLKMMFSKYPLLNLKFLYDLTSFLACSLVIIKSSWNLYDIVCKLVRICFSPCLNKTQFLSLELITLLLSSEKMSLLSYSKVVKYLSREAVTSFSILFQVLISFSRVIGISTASSKLYVVSGSAAFKI
jgi:hypothetical protein